MNWQELISDPLYFPAWPVNPFFCNAVNTSLSLKSPLTVKDFAPLVAVFPVTPFTSPSAVFTALTHLPQQRCTFSTSKDFTLLSLAPVSALNLIVESLLFP